MNSKRPKTSEDSSSEPDEIDVVDTVINEESADAVTCGTTTRYGRKVIPVLPHTPSKPKKDVSSDESDETSVEKPPTLFDEQALGSQVYGFKTAKGKNAMVDKVNSSLKKILINQEEMDIDSDDEAQPSTSAGISLKENHSDSASKKTVSTPNKEEQPKDNEGGSSTPYSLRTRLKGNYKNKLREEDDMFDLTDSEYDPSESSSSSESESEEDGVSELPANNESPPETNVTPTVNRRLNKKNEFVPSSDNYFDRRSGRKATSNNTLGNAGPRMNISQLNDLLSNYTSGHQDAIKAMNKNTTVFFNRWLYSLKMGFNILIYGVGSKKSLIYWFYKRYLSQSHTLFVNGFFPGLTLKELEDNVCELVGLRESESGDTLVSTVARSKKQIFLLIHNLDGEAMRSKLIQNFIANLASLRNVFLVASIDHINAPLLWDQKKLGKFNFIWEDGTTFLPYKEETSFESSIMIQGTGNSALVALKNVMKSLTPNQRKVFNILMEFHINTKGRNTGMYFSDLYHACRADFIVSSDLALRTLVNEFIDHMLIKWKRENDTYLVAVDVDTLKSYKSEIANDL